MHLARDEDDGFSLVELLMVVAILGILISIALASYSLTIGRAQRVACLGNQRVLEAAAQEYAVDNNGDYPTDFAELQPYVDTPVGRVTRCVTDGSVNLKLDPGTGQVDCPLHAD